MTALLSSANWSSELVIGGTSWKDETHDHDGGAAIDPVVLRAESSCESSGAVPGSVEWSSEESSAQDPVVRGAAKGLR